jgi:hypothetical protein
MLCKMIASCGDTMSMPTTQRTRRQCNYRPFTRPGLFQTSLATAATAAFGA